MVDFTDVLSKRVDEIEKPKPKPVGTYLGTISGLPKQRTVLPKDGGEGMPVLGFNIKLMAAQPDVDPDSLSEAPDISEWAGFQYDMFLHTEGGVYALKQFLLNTLGIDGDNKSLGEMVAEAPGKQLLVKLKHEPFVNSRTNEAEIATRIESTAHV